MERTLHGDCVGQLGAALPSAGPLEFSEGLGARSTDGLPGQHSRTLQRSAGEFGTEHGPADGWFQLQDNRAKAANENRRTGSSAEWVED